MSQITAADVAKLREMTNVGMMDCKKALTEAKGDLKAAVDILRKKGRATAAVKSVREAREAPSPSTSRPTENSACWWK